MWPHSVRVVMPFLQYRGSPAFWRDLFYDLSVSRFSEAGLRILPQAGAAVSPTDKSRKDNALPPGTSEKASPPADD